jgi:HEAT repeat protein
MTHHTRQGIGGLIVIIYLCLSMLTFLTSHGLAGQHTDTTVSDLITFLKDQEPIVRQGVAAALGGLGEKAAAAVPVLIEALKDQEPDVRQHAAIALGNIGPQAKAAVPALIEALKDSGQAPDVRRAAAIALGEIHERRLSPPTNLSIVEVPDPATIPALIEALKDQDPTTRRNAIIALGLIGPQAEAAVPALIEALKGQAPDLRTHSAYTLGAIGPQAEAAVPALIEALKHEDRNTAHAVANALERIAISLQDAEATAMIGPLNAAHEALSDRGFDSQAQSVRRTVKFLELLWRRNLTKWLWQGIDEHPYLSVGIAFYLALFLCWLIFYWVRPLWLYQLNEALKPFTDWTLKWFGEIKFPLRYVLLVGFFHYRPRILNAWITQHLTTARAEFPRKTTVRDRAIHIPVPVNLDGHEISHLTVEHVRPTFNQSRACLLIWGEGGVGKTSLACQVARWAMADMPSERLCAQYSMLPVLIEQPLELKDKEHPHPFTDALRGELQALTRAEDPIPEEFALRLLRRRRVLVIVDHFSEMPDAMRQEIRPGQPEFPANALIITSRREERLGGVSPTTVKPLRIQGQWQVLASFLEDYLTARGKRDYFDIAEFFEYCHRLSLMVGTRNITVLLAKLYAELMIAAKEGSTDGSLPETIPDLMLSYVNEVNRGVESHQQDDRLVHRVAKAIAWECLKRTYRPTPALRQNVLAALTGEQDAEVMLTYLENRLRLIQTWGAGRNEIRFTLDPLAEYLAGLHVLDQYGDNEDMWREFLTLADTMPGAPDAIKEFLLAMHDCCLAKVSDAKVPTFLLDELANRAGVNAEIGERAPQESASVEGNITFDFI